MCVDISHFGRKMCRAYSDCMRIAHNKWMRYARTTFGALAGAPTTTRMLDVPGASVYYEVRGSGPVLLMMGAPLPSAFFAEIASLLAGEYTVVTCDPRGIGRSVCEDPDEDVTPELLADDTQRLLAALGSEPASMFGTSGGAIGGLALVTRHPRRLRTLIAHEPPLLELLPERARLRAAIDDVAGTYRHSGSVAAWAKFLSATGLGSGPTPTGNHLHDAPDPTAAPVQSGPRPDDHQFFVRMLGPLTRYRPDFAALRAASTSIVVAAGATSSGQVPHRTAAALAEQLHTTLTSLPGDHGGFGREPQATATALRQTLAKTG